MIVYKIKWKSYIIDLYLPPKKAGKIVILVPGLPKSSNKDKLIKVFISSGCVVFCPSFSGTYDSGGSFNGLQSVRDVREFIKCGLQSEVKELYFGKEVKLGSHNELTLVGMSFGAVISLLALNKRIDKLMLLSPALLFNQDDISQIVDFNFRLQMDFLMGLLKNAFPYTYRVKSFRLLRQFLYGEITQLSRNNIERFLRKVEIPTLVIHGKADHSVPWQVSDELRKSVQNKKIKWKFPNVGHSNSSYNNRTLMNISKFIKL